MDRRDNFARSLVGYYVIDALEIPVHAGAAVEFVGQAVVVNRAGIQAGGEVGDSGGVAIGAAPLGQEGGQSRSIVVVIGGAADQDVAAAAGLQGGLAGAADEDVAALTTDEAIRAAAADQHVVGTAARDIQCVVSIAVEDQAGDVDVGQHAVERLRGSLDDVVA